MAGLTVAEEDSAPEASIVFTCEDKDKTGAIQTICLLCVAFEQGLCFELKLIPDSSDALMSSSVQHAPVQSSVFISKPSTQVLLCTLPYHELMLAILDILRPKASSLCMLGHGLGEAAISWASRLHARGEPVRHISAVDSCKSVLDLSKSLLAELPQHVQCLSDSTQFFACDVEQFVAEVLPGAIQLYDVVVLDIGASGSAPDDELLAPPAAFFSAGWVQAVLARCCPGGVLLINLLASAREHLAAAISRAHNVGRAVSPHDYAVYVASGQGHYPCDLNVVLVLRSPESEETSRLCPPNARGPEVVHCTTALGMQFSASLSLDTGSVSSSAGHVQAAVSASQARSDGCVPAAQSHSQNKEPPAG